MAAIEFGLQPSLFSTSNGTPLYAPFRLSQTIPAMMLAHLLVAGVVEAVLTFGVITYLQRANLPVCRSTTDAAPAPDRAGAAGPLGWRWAVIGLGVMAVLTPLGLLAPGGAFGEDAPEDLDLRKYHLETVPRGLRHYAGFFHNALFDGYGFSNDDHPTLGYLVSAAVGLLAIAIVIFTISRSCAPCSAATEPVARPGHRLVTTSATVEAAVPDWLCNPRSGSVPCGCIGKRSKRNFIDRTIDGGAGVMRHVLRVDDVAARPGLLQRIDPRCKVVGLMGLLVVAAVVHHAVVLLGVYVVALAAAVASSIQASFFVKRVWLFVPIFTGIVVLPATLNVVTGGDIVVPLGTWFGHEVGMTGQGCTAQPSS